MTIHAWVQYLGYRWRAKSRHGIHSPFVYSFIEDVLQDRKKQFASGNLRQYLFPGLQCGRLAARIAQYYNYESIFCIPGNEPGIIESPDMLIIMHDDPAQSAACLNEYLPKMKNAGIILLAGIHRTLAHTRQWEKASADRRVRMSIDLYDVGLLLFRDEFREQQHFVLRNYVKEHQNKSPPR